MIDRFSATKIGDYLSCPKLFYYRYIAKIELPTSKQALVFGSAVHKAIEEAWNNRDAHAGFDREFKIEKLDVSEHNQFNGLFEDGHIMVDNFLKQMSWLTSEHGVQGRDTERFIRTTFVHPDTGEPLQIPMSGKVDQLLPDAVIDYKTSKGKKDDSIWQDLGIRIQSLTYSYWFYQEMGKLPKRILYIYLVKPEVKKEKQDDKSIKLVKRLPSESIQVFSTTYTISDLISYFEEVKIVLAKIENRIFDEKPANHPYWCQCKDYEMLLKI